MSILIDYQNKRNALRRVVAEMVEFNAAMDVGLAAKFNILKEIHTSKIDPGMEELYLCPPVIHFPLWNIQPDLMASDIRRYLSTVQNTLGREPVDISMGRE